LNFFTFFKDKLTEQRLQNSKPKTAHKENDMKIKNTFTSPGVYKKFCKNKKINISTPTSFVYTLAVSRCVGI